MRFFLITCCGDCERQRQRQREPEPELERELERELAFTSAGLQVTGVGVKFCN